MLGAQLDAFRDTITSRIAVDSVIEMVDNGAQFTFDYVCFCVIASILACVGLVTNNSVIIVASMLVSPLMGPILGFTFGWTLNVSAMGCWVHFILLRREELYFVAS